MVNDENSGPQFLSTLSKKARIVVALCAVWTLIVIFRTSGDQYILGMVFQQWEPEMFFANLLIVPGVGFSAFWVYRWISKAK